MNLIESSALAKVIAKKGPVSTERKQQIADHVGLCPADTRDLLINQLLGGMTSDEVAFLKEALGLDASATTPAAPAPIVAPAQSPVPASN